MVPVKQGKNGFNATVVARSCRGNKAEKDPNSIVMSITVNDAFGAIPSLP